MSKYVVAAMYKFVTLEDCEAIRVPLLKIMSDNMVRGTLILAREGINGTIAGTALGVSAVLSFLKLDLRFANIIHKESYNDYIPFNRAKIKLKKEIVTLGFEVLDFYKGCDRYVKPKDWNRIISDPEVLLIDTRNIYEIEIGTFKKAVNPHTENFCDFPEYVKKNLDKIKHKKVAMYCTGGIRCEKSTAFLKEQGFDKVYHLEGGILKYLEEVPIEESLWEGECFVFDSRVSLTHDLVKGQYDQCYACRRTITEEDKLKPEYKRGISCHRCEEQTTFQQRKRFLEREKQSKLAHDRGEQHFGEDANQIAVIRKVQKEKKRRREYQENKNT